jgi:Uma2 family endonuclease
MTVAEFLVWDSGDDSGRRWQLVEGEPVAMAPAREPHGAIQIELGRLLANHLLETRRPCRVIGEPGIVPAVRPERNFRIPDLGVTCAPPGDRAMVPDPILLIEVLSPSNEHETRANIPAYASIPSVIEVLIIHSKRIQAELFRRRDDGEWPEVPRFVGPDAVLELASIGFAIPLVSVYRTTALAAGSA